MCDRLEFVQISANDNASGGATIKTIARSSVTAIGAPDGLARQLPSREWTWLECVNLLGTAYARFDANDGRVTCAECGRPIHLNTDYVCADPSFREFWRNLRSPTRRKTRFVGRHPIARAVVVATLLKIYRHPLSGMTTSRIEAMINSAANDNGH